MHPFSSKAASLEQATGFKDGNNTSVPTPANSRRLKICLIQLWPRQPHYYCSQLANSLTPHCSVSVCVTGNPPIHLYDPGIDIIRIPLRVPVKYKKTDLPLLAAQLPLAHLLYKEVRATCPDVVHIAFPHPYASIAGLYLRKHVPVILDRHDVAAHPGEEGFLRTLFDELDLLVPHGLIVHGRLQQQRIEVRLKQRATPIYSIPHGDLSFISRSSPPPNEPSEGGNVLFFGRVHDYKGLDALLNAVPRVLSVFPETRFVVAGEGDWAPYSELIAAIPPRNLTLIPKFVSENEAAALFTRASLVVLPYREASQSGVIPFAAAFRRAVIATRVGSLAESIKDGESGILVAPQDPEALARAILLLLKDKAKRLAMAEALHKDFTTRFSFTSLSRSYMDCYRSMIKMHAQRYF